MKMAFGSAVKRLCFAASPRLAIALHSARARAYSHKMVRRWGCFDLNHKLLERVGNRVLYGPFKDLILSPLTANEHLAPYLLGSYESELHPALESVLAKPFKQIIDVGAKFGYYAIGFARHFPQTEVIAFDTDSWARKAIQEMKVANETPNVSIDNFCTPKWFQRRLKPDAFILSDCEGFEATLFTKIHTPAMRSATMLIEIHESVSPGVAKAIDAAFCSSHAISTIAQCPQKKMALHALEKFDVREQQLALNELRAGEQAWLFLRPMRVTHGGERLNAVTTPGF